MPDPPAPPLPPPAGPTRNRSLPAIAVLAALIAGLAAVVSGDNAITRLDADIVAGIAGDRTPWLTDLARAVTTLGHALVVLGLLLVIGAGLVATRVLGPRTALLPVVALGLAAGLAQVIKAIVDRPRPPRDLWVVVEHSSGYPSGHSAQAAAAWLTLGLVVWLFGRGHRRWPLVLAVGVTLAVGCSRVVLSVHSPTDVLGGWALGLLSGLVVLALLGRWAAPHRPAEEPQGA